MRLPQYESQISAPQREVVEPLQQTFGIESAQIKQQIGSSIQAFGGVVSDRLEQIAKQNNQMKMNESTVKFQSEEIKKRQEFIQKSGKNSFGVTEEYAKWYADQKKKTLSEISDPADKKKMELMLDENYASSLNQMSSHEYTQKKSYNSNLTAGIVALAQQNAVENSSDANIMIQLKRIKDSYTQDDESNGIPKELTDAKYNEVAQNVVTGIINRYIQDDEIDSAERKLESNVEYIGGHGSDLYKSFKEKITTIMQERDVYSTADSIAEQFYGKPGGIQKAFDYVAKMKVDAKLKERYEAEITQRFTMLEKDRIAKIDKYKTEFTNKILENQYAVTQKSTDTVTAMKTLRNELIRTAPDKDTYNDLFSKLLTTFKPDTKDPAIAALIESNRTISAVLESTVLKEKSEVQRLQRDLRSGARFNNAQEIYNRYQIPLDRIDSISGAWGIPNLRETAAKIVGPSNSVVKDIDKLDLKPDEFTELIDFVNDRRKDFISVENRQPIQLEVDNIFTNAIAKHQVKVGQKKKFFGGGTKPVYKKVPAFKAQVPKYAQSLSGKKYVQKGEKLFEVIE
jgi:hypothetical protein